MCGGLVRAAKASCAVLGLPANPCEDVSLPFSRLARHLGRPGVQTLARTAQRGGLRNEEVVPSTTVWRDGLPLTAPARTLVDIVGEQATMAVSQALSRGLVTERQLDGPRRSAEANRTSCAPSTWLTQRKKCASAGRSRAGPLGPRWCCLVGTTNCTAALLASRPTAEADYPGQPPFAQWK